MTLVRPSPVENQIGIMSILQPDRPKYYSNVIQTARNIFMMLGFDGSDENYPNKVEEMMQVVREEIEIPFEAPFFCIEAAFDASRYRNSKKAYCVIGEGIDAIEVTNFQIEQHLNRVKQWCYDNVMMLTPYVRFVARQPM